MSENMDKIKEYIESVIEGSLPDEEGHAKPVIEAMNYAVRGGGKRIRPLLMYLTYMSFCNDVSDETEQSGNNDNSTDNASEKRAGNNVSSIVEPFMAALEMIHCYSLVHDDILDNDDLRRGKPSCHKQYGKDMALLAGDGLLNYAYETAARAFTMKPGDIDVEKAFFVLTFKPGLYGMLGGQTADVYLTGKPVDENQLEYIYRNKTSALIECAMMIGAILARLPQNLVDSLENVAYKVGMAFQVRDDILDIEGDEKLLGKTVGQDADNDKYTFARIHGLDESRKYVEDITKEALEILAEIGKEADSVNEEYFSLLTDVLKSLATRNM